MKAKRRKKCPISKWETLQFIQEKKAGSYWYDDNKYNRYELKLDYDEGANELIFREFKPNATYTSPYDYTYKIPINKLDPTSVEYGDENVTLNTRGRKDEIRCTYKEYIKARKWLGLADDSFQTERSYDTSSVDIRAYASGNPENPAKLAKAFRHFIELCGGKSELF
ncbi:hypothetical protein QUF76_07770 [Desulfobacterales bacterium HSG16]|nr:hypothetical protein [Desulfobacterales bacterium HSG16]